MTARQDLHDFVSHLGEEQSHELLTHLRAVVGEATPIAAAPDGRTTPLLVPGATFFSEQAMSLQLLAAAQGVAPIMKDEDLRGDFWHVEETDEFDQAIRSWRSESGSS